MGKTKEESDGDGDGDGIDGIDDIGGIDGIDGGGDGDGIDCIDGDGEHKSKASTHIKDRPECIHKHRNMSTCVSPVISA